MIRRLLFAIILAVLSAAGVMAYLDYEDRKRRFKVFRMFKSLISDNGPKAYTSGNDVNIIKVDFLPKRTIPAEEMDKL